MWLFVLIVAAEAPLAADGLPVSSMAEATQRIEIWDKCLKDKAESPAKYTNDPSDLVAEIVMDTCDVEFSNAKFSWRRGLVAESTFRPSDKEAEMMAEETFSKFALSRKKSLITTISYIRQKHSLDRELEALRARK